MKRFVSLLALSVCMTIVMAQPYKMVIRVNNDTALGFPDGKISIPVDDISEVTFEDINNITPSTQIPITFQFLDYSTSVTRSPLRKAPALTARKYGVFGCYNNGEPISQDNLSANIMNNQLVTYADGGWEYAPIKYWQEKEQGNNFTSFFAYSPYADESSNGFVSVNSTTTVPMIEYKSINPMDDAGDLLYGSQTNATKNTNNGCVTIESRHALARLNLKAALFEEKDANTKITIKSVKISGQIPSSGQFDLYRQQWKNLSTEAQTFTLEGDNLVADLRDAGETSAASQPEGVTYNSKLIGVNPYLFIPTDGEKVITFTVEYYVTTDNTSLTTGYARVNHVISKTFSMKLIAGYSYDIQIGFGMNSLRYSINANSSWTSDVVIGF